MRAITLCVSLFVLCVVGASANLELAQQDKSRQMEEKLHNHMASKSADFVKLPPLSQQQVVKALREIILRKMVAQSNGKLNLNISSGSLPCWICEKAVHWLVDHANDWACDFAFDGIAATACEAAGLGPFDPWSDLCVALIIAGCNVILGDIENHITNDHRICGDIHLC
jgi:hypothetical protein